jgi:hypothetical protein
VTRPRPAPEDLEILVPQWQAARDILRRWPLGDSLDDLAAILVLKTVAITWRQVSDALPEPEVTHTTLQVPEGPDDGGFL